PGFEADEFAKLGVVMSLEEICLAVPKICKIFLGKIDAALFSIRAEVAQNIGELKGHAKIYSIVLGVGGDRTKDVQADQPDDRGDTITIERQLIERPIPCRRQIHLNAFD